MLFMVPVPILVLIFLARWQHAEMTVIVCKTPVATTSR